MMDNLIHAVTLKNAPAVRVNGRVRLIVILTLIENLRRKLSKFRPHIVHRILQVTSRI